MGGFGSGRREYARTPTVERCRHLEANRLVDVTTASSATRRVSWGDSDDPSATIGVRPEGVAGDLPDDVDEPRAARLRLTYTTTSTRTDETTEHDYTIDLEYTPCHFGGVRPWFRCPACGDRVGKVYLPPRRERFACRDCYELGYTSSRRSGDPAKEAELRYRRAFAKADVDDRRPHPSNEPYLPERPPGRPHDHHAELLEDVHAARDEWDAALQRRLRSIGEYLEKTDPPSA